VTGFAREPAQLAYFSVPAPARGTDKKANGAAGVVFDKLSDDRNDRIIDVHHSEQNFVFRVIEIAEAGEVLVAFAVQPPDRFQDADRGREPRVAVDRTAEISPGAEQRSHVVKQGYNSAD
jgi:hypothetical protein